MKNIQVYQKIKKLGKCVGKFLKAEKYEKHTDKFIKK